jgi:hypothetical protein
MIFYVQCLFVMPNLANRPTKNLKQPHQQATQQVLRQAQATMFLPKIDTVKCIKSIKENGFLIALSPGLSPSPSMSLWRAPRSARRRG